MVCEAVAESEVVSPTGVPPGKAPDALYSKKPATHLLWRQLTMVREVIAESNICPQNCLARSCTLVKHWTPVHEKLYSKTSTTRLLWQLTMVCEAIAQSEVVSLADSPLSSTGARPQKAELQDINHSLVVATADHGV